MVVKNDVFEFPEDNNIVHTNMDDYTTELLNGGESSSSTSLSEDPPNQIFRTSVVFACSAAASLLSTAILTRYSPILGSALSLVSVLILREWNRIFGGLLTPQRKASINFASILRDHKEYIPYYDMDWLFGAKYKPYYYGCTGPSLNPDMDRTPDDPESRSPVKERKDEKLTING